MGLSVSMMRKCRVIKAKPIILLLCLCGFLSAQGTSLTPGTWTSLSPTGDYMCNPAGYDASTYVPATNTVLTFANFLTIGVTSEGQDSMCQFSYAQNRRTVLEEGGGWHGGHRPAMGHQMGIQIYIPAWNSVIWQTNYSFGNDINEYLYMYGYDMGGNTTFQVPMMSVSGTYTASWYNTNQLSGAAYEAASGTVTFYPDSRNSTGATTCTPGTALQLTCTQSSGATNPNVISQVVTAGNGRVYVFGGGASTSVASQATYTYNPASPSSGFTLLTTTCSGADCSGTAPAARFNPSMTWDPDDSLFMMCGGTAANEGSGALFQDCYTLNPSTNAWTEICGPGVNTAGCAALGQTIPQPGNRLVYDTVDHVFIWESSNASPSLSGNYAAFALSGGAFSPLNYGRTSFSGLATAGAISKTVPSASYQRQCNGIFVLSFNQLKRQQYPGCISHRDGYSGHWRKLSGSHPLYQHGNVSWRDSDYGVPPHGFPGDRMRCHWRSGATVDARKFPILS